MYVHICYIYNRANDSSQLRAFHSNIHNTSNYMSVVSLSTVSGSEGSNTGLGHLPFSCLLFSLKAVIISFSSIAPGNEHHEPTTVVALIDLLESKCLILD